MTDEQEAPDEVISEEAYDDESPDAPKDKGLIKTSRDQKEWVKLHLAKALALDANENMYYLALALNYMVCSDNISECFTKERIAEIKKVVSEFMAKYNYCMNFSNIIKKLGNDNYTNKKVMEIVEIKVKKVSIKMAVIQLPLMQAFVEVIRKTDIRNMPIPKYDLIKAKDNKRQFSQREDYKQI